MTVKLLTFCRHRMPFAITIETPKISGVCLTVMIDDDGIQEGGLVNLPVNVDEDLPGAGHQVKVFADQLVAVLAASVGAFALGATGRGGHQESPEQVLQALESLVDDGPGVLFSQR